MVVVDCDIGGVVVEVDGGEDYVRDARVLFEQGK